MSITQTLNEWLAVIGEMQGQSLALSPEGTVGFLYNNEVEVVISVDDQSPIMFCLAVIVDLNDEDPDFQNDVLAEAMRLNLYKQVTAGGALAFDQHHQRLVLNKSILVAELTPERFVAEVEPFGLAAVQLVKTFRGEPVGAGEQETSPDSDSEPNDETAPPPGPPMGWRA